MFNFHEYNTPERRYYEPPRKRYGFLGFLGDVFMTIITGGFWILWIFVREMRRP